MCSIQGQSCVCDFKPTQIRKESRAKTNIVEQHNLKQIKKKKKKIVKTVHFESLLQVSLLQSVEKCFLNSAKCKAKTEKSLTEAFFIFLI